MLAEGKRIRWRKAIMDRAISIRIILCFTLVSLFTGCAGLDTAAAPDDAIIDPYDIDLPKIKTFESDGDEICMEDGKPVIRLFSATWCPYCQWISGIYDAIVQIYVDEGRIVAYHWEVDIGDDTLTGEVEQGVPDSEIAVFDTFNPQRSVPAFVFGCKYYRIGTGYGIEGDLESEAVEFVAVIESLLSE